ncbi:HNH endonuclease [Rummeliibacillus stabekisii]|uniref:HNH nuclease domain-containing protein n=1 Tax=Rummeliibacillus stabekisii TaxID=241244 RepID=A0A143H9M7_9BACL|nr:HNH endonuclease [Rummeliibacillus stabekisii]AMW98434.1 hypothetical protein ATY39_02695 [Rummeliibacillus stabekisii]
MERRCSFCNSTHRVSRFKGGDLYCLKHYLQMRNHGKVTNDPPLRKWRNKIIIGNTFSTIVTSKGEKIIIDNQKVPMITQHSWCLSKTGYAVANIKGTTTKMHRLITNCQPGMVVDHINGNPLDNRLGNLRICSAKNNSRNKGVGSNNSTGVLGVSKLKSGLWRVRIMVNKKEINLGRYESFDEAVKVRREAELKYFGEYSHTASRGKQYEL